MWFHTISVAKFSKAGSHIGLNAVWAIWTAAFNGWKMAIAFYFCMSENSVLISDILIGNTSSSIDVLR